LQNGEGKINPFVFKKSFKPLISPKSRHDRKMNKGKVGVEKEGHK
jgi:hypothetical protein